MSRYQLKTFKDIQDAIAEEVGIQEGDTVARNRIKRDINFVYLNEVVPKHTWWWLRESYTAVIDPAFSTGTASVTNNSRTVTLSEMPAVSFKGHWFATTSFSHRYRIKAHTAGTSTVELEVPYTGVTAATSAFTIWTDEVALPPEANEVDTVMNDAVGRELTLLGHNEFKRYVTSNPRVEGEPRYCVTSDYVDVTPFAAISGLPTITSVTSVGKLKTVVFNATLGSGDTLKIREGDKLQLTGGTQHYRTDNAIVFEVSQTSVANDTIKYIGDEAGYETSAAPGTLAITKWDSPAEGRRYRNLLFYPAISRVSRVLQIDYIQEALPLENDSDEPLIPMEYRAVLYYGALQRAWVKAGDSENTAISRAEKEAILADMKAKLGDTPDKARLKVNRQYLRSMRGQGTRTNLDHDLFGTSGAAGSAATPLGTANSVAVFGSLGRLESYPSISTTELSYLDNATSNIQDQLDAITDEVNKITVTIPQGNPAATLATFTTQPLTIKYTAKRGTRAEIGELNIVKSSGSVVYSSVVDAGDGQVTLFATEAGPNIIVLIDTSVGTFGDAVVTYQVTKWDDL